MEQRKRSMIGPLILITLGALLPLANTGAHPRTFWEIAARIRADQRIGSTKIDRTRFPKTSGVQVPTLPLPQTESRSTLMAA